MKCLNCVKEATGRSKYCSDKCKVSYNRNKKRNTVSVTNPSVTVEPHASVTPVAEIPVTINSDKPERGGGITIPDGVKSTLIRPKTEKQFMDAVRDIVKPANFGASDCMCKMCIGNRAKPTPLMLNHGVWKRCDQLGRDEINRVPLPGDVDYVGVAV